MVDDSHPESLVRQLPPKVRQCVSPEQTLGLRVPGHQVVLDVLRMLVGPLALTSANRTGEPEAVTGPRGARVPWATRSTWCWTTAPAASASPPRWSACEGNRYEILRAGVVPEKTLQRLSSLMILFVCTGNTCRSPMAEAICRQLLARRLGCRSTNWRTAACW